MSRLFFLKSFCRHSDEMISKLEQAGLGFYVKQEKTADRLGKDCFVTLVTLSDGP